MTEVRSVVLARGFVTTAGAHTVITAPAGLTLLVKEWHASASLAANQDVSLYVTRSGVAGPVYLNFTTLTVGIHIATWTGWIVLMPGDVMLIGKGTAERVDYWISGTALHGVETVYVPQPPSLLFAHVLPADA